MRSRLQPFNLFADPAGLFLAVPKAPQSNLYTLLKLGLKRLTQTSSINTDKPRGGGEDMRGGAVVLFQPDHRGAGEILFEPQDVSDLGPAPAVDRLVVVADAADVPVRLRQKPQPEVLADVGVLVF